MKLALLSTDILIYLLLFIAIGFAVWARKREHILLAWSRVLNRPIAVMSVLILCLFVLIGLLDSFHYRTVLSHENDHTIYTTKSTSLLDSLLAPLGEQMEKSYSAPFSMHLFNKETIQLPSGQTVRDYPRLRYVANNISAQQQMRDIQSRILLGLWRGLLIFSLLVIPLIIFKAKKAKQRIGEFCYGIQRGLHQFPWRTFLLTLFVVITISCITLNLAQHYHILGTNKVGQDVFYLTLKSIRTGLVIGTLTTLFMLPFALLLGTMAGFFGGIVDDIIQYIYITLSSIPGVLLIAAAILSLQVFISNHSELFPNLASRADARLLALCLILGITSWTGLCRLLRAETLKVREIDYIQAARSMGVSSLRTIGRHILPNVLHIVLITIALDFSGLVLAEAVLSYVGVGVDPSAISWGNMINSARLELAREPVVWWPLLAAFIFMFTLVLAANLFADAVRDAFDPKLKT